MMEAPQITSALNNAQAGRVQQPTPAWLAEFRPHRWLANGHLQTIVGNYLPRPAFLHTPEAETVLVDKADNSHVLCHNHWQPEEVRAARLTLVLVHGLEGSSNSRYIQGLAARGWTAGCNVVCMNMRNCGGTDHLTPTLYHSGLSGDVAAVVRHFTHKFALERVALVGYSMGGNLVMKMAGEWGSAQPLVAVAAVCPAVDLALGSDALHEPANRLYEAHFLRGLTRRYLRKAALYPDIYEPRLGRLHSLRDFDHNVVARYCGFTGADDYYHRAAAARVVSQIAVPTYALFAADDPFIRLAANTREKLAANPLIHFVETAHGGHCAYLGREPGNQIHWAEATVLRFLLAATKNSFNEARNGS